MIGSVINWSAPNSFLVLLAMAFIVFAGVYAEYPGQAPQVIEDQVTYPLTTALLAVPLQGGARF